MDFFTVVNQYKNNICPETKLMLLKACYEEYDKVNGVLSKLHNVASKSYICITTIKNNAKIYAIEVLGMSEKEFSYKYIYPQIKLEDKLRNKPISNTKSNLILTKLLTLDNEFEIIKLIETANIDIRVLKNNISNFSCQYYFGIRNEIKKLLIDKINGYIVYATKKEKEQNRLRRVQMSTRESEEYKLLELCIKEFITTESHSIETLCKRKHL